MTPLPVDMRVLPVAQHAKDLQEFALRVRPPQPETSATSAEQWRVESAALRKRLLDEVFFDATMQKLIGTTPPQEVGVVKGDGFTVRKLKVELLEDFYGPMLVYEPTKALESGELRPVVISFTGHVTGGDITAPVHQARAIHLARQGCIVVGVEWFGNGELEGLSNDHAHVNLLDLVGVHGVGIHGALIRRAIDVALAQPKADPSRLAAVGLSGGGWLAMMAGALDERVTLVNSVSGFGAYEARAARVVDLGDSEQSPAGFYTIADYTTLAAMIAPRPLLLTYNEPDSCCFRASTQLPPLEKNLIPVWKLFGADDKLRFYTSTNPGTHNFEADNRAALYRFLADMRFVDRSFSPDEGDLAAITPPSAQLRVGISERATLRKLTDSITDRIKRSPLPATKEELPAWQKEKREHLRSILHISTPPIAQRIPRKKRGRELAAPLVWRVGDAWTVVGVSHEPKGPLKGTTVIISDSRKDACVGEEAARAVEAGDRAVALDLLHTGDLHLRYGDALYSLFFAATNRPSIGIQVDQLRSVIQSLRGNQARPVNLVACSMRMSFVALATTGVDDQNAIGALTLYDPRQSLLGAAGIHKRPEMFPFGILTELDMPELYVLAFPRPLTIHLDQHDLPSSISRLAKTLGTDVKIEGRARRTKPSDT
jgi:dienelactone hydrolase